MTMSFLKSTPVRVRGVEEQRAPVELSFSERPLPGEPGLESMDAAVRLIEARLRASSRLVLSVSWGLMRDESERIRVVEHLKGVVMGAASDAEDLGYPSGKQSVYYALYVFGLFRFGLSTADLASLEHKLVQLGVFSHRGALRRLSTHHLQQMALKAHEFTSAKATPLAHLGLDQRHWR